MSKLVIDSHSIKYNLCTAFIEQKDWINASLVFAELCEEESLKDSLELAHLHEKLTSLLTHLDGQSIIIKISDKDYSNKTLKLLTLCLDKTTPLGQRFSKEKISDVLKWVLDCAKVSLCRAKVEDKETKEWINDFVSMLTKYNEENKVKFINQDYWLAAKCYEAVYNKMPSELIATQIVRSYLSVQTGTERYGRRYVDPFILQYPQNAELYYWRGLLETRSNEPLSASLDYSKAKELGCVLNDTKELDDQLSQHGKHILLELIKYENKLKKPSYVPILKLALDKTTPLGKRFWKKEGGLECSLQRGTLKEIAELLAMAEKEMHADERAMGQHSGVKDLSMFANGKELKQAQENDKKFSDEVFRL